MSKMFQVYGVGQALFPVLPPPLPFENPPTVNQTNYEIGQLVFSPPQTPTAFYFYAGGGSWIELATSSGNVLSVTGTANQILATPTSGAVVLSLIGPYTPATYTAHGVLIGEGTGSIVATAVGATGTLFSGVTGADPVFTASPSVSGNITAATGFVATTAGAGITLNSGSTSGTTTSTLNGRSGQITITTPTINAGATFTMTISNTSITGSGTQVLYGLTGGTTGSAITIQSVTNSANQSAVVVQNASAVTNSTGSLVLTFLVLN